MPVRTTFQAPWQNGIAEGWIESCRRELLDHIIALNEKHLLRLLRKYADYHHGARIHDALGKDCLHPRIAEHRPDNKAKTQPAHESVVFTTDTSGVLLPSSPTYCFPHRYLRSECNLEARARHV